MVTRSDVISSRWSSHFWFKIHVFSTSFNNKSKSCGKKSAKCLFICCFSCKAQKLQFLAVLTWFLILMAIIVGDVTDLQQRHHPWNIPHLVKKIKGFPLKVKSFRNTAACQKLRGGVPSTPPPPSFVPRWGYEFACTSEGYSTACIKWIWYFRRKMQTNMILRPLLQYWVFIQVLDSTARIVSFGAWHNSELAGRTGDFVSWINIHFFKSFCSKHIITLHNT